MSAREPGSEILGGLNNRGLCGGGKALLVTVKDLSVEQIDNLLLGFRPNNIP